MHIEFKLIADPALDHLSDNQILQSAFKHLGADLVGEDLDIRMLGGKCADCGSSKQLHFDHRDPAEKLFSISNGLDGPWSRLVKEVWKCELRCKPCHIKRSVALGHLGALGERNGMWVEALHGTSKMYATGCKCTDCKQWKRLYRVKKVDSRGCPVAS